MSLRGGRFRIPLAITMYEDIIQVQNCLLNVNQPTTHLTPFASWCGVNSSPCLAAEFLTNHSSFMWGLWLEMCSHCSQGWVWACDPHWDNAALSGTQKNWETLPGDGWQWQIWISAIVFLCCSKNGPEPLKIFLGNQVQKSQESAFLFPEKMETHFKNPTKGFDSVCVRLN